MIQNHGFKGFTTEYSDIVASNWNRYIKNNKLTEEMFLQVRPIICDSWKRSKSYNISPFEVKDEKLSEDDLKRALIHSSELISVAHSYILNLYSFVKGTNYIIALTNAKGQVIDLVGGDTNIQARAKKSGLTMGCIRSEKHAGTNGIGTCLAIGKPLQIWGHEHYIKPHHTYVCSAAPIRNPDGEIIGCLDLVGPMEILHAHTLGMVCASVDGIEKAMKMERAHQKISMVNSQLESALQSISSGILMIDEAGIITQYNENFAKLLGLHEKSLYNKNIAHIIDLNASSINLLKILKAMNNVEATIVTMEKITIKSSLSASIINNAAGVKIGVLLVIDELVRIHNLVNKLSGFTAKYTFASILGDSQAMRAVKELGLMASKGNSNVLILGESGTGKELMAQSIHNASKRSRKPFIAINCGSLPRGLIESELFGYERGSFTGANKEGYPGKFELADGGTIFLDEIGDMPLELQASLLRVIQNKEIVRIGGKTSKSVDVRIMAATNIDLLACVENKSFRSDLYYRLNVLSLIIPPLREHPEDIPMLTAHFIESCNDSVVKKIKAISPDALAVLCKCLWPGNIRQLGNVIERSIHLAQGDMIHLSDLTEDIIMTIPKAASTGEKLEIILALEEFRGKINPVSERLCMPKRTLYRKIQKYKIDLSIYRN